MGYLASLPLPSLESVLSVFSVLMTGYFWFVKARRERPDLQIYQLRDFRSSLRRGTEPNTKRLCLTQVDGCGVLIANNSTRQNSIIRFECFLTSGESKLKGRWGYVDNDTPPWNIGPESTISLCLACFFDVPEDFEIPENMAFRVEFLTVGEKRFPHEFSLRAPEL